MSGAQRSYDCTNCPAYCCSYEGIEVRDADLARLAERFGITRAAAERRFTKHVREGGVTMRVMRHREDAVFGSVCRFLGHDPRVCTIYDSRPAICRAYPGSARCGFYDFLCSERRAQDDPDYVPSFRRR